MRDESMAMASESPPSPESRGGFSEEWAASSDGGASEEDGDDVVITVVAMGASPPSLLFWRFFVFLSARLAVGLRPPGGTLLCVAADPPPNPQK